MAQRFGLRLIEVPAIDANGRKPDGGVVEGLPAAQQAARPLAAGHRHYPDGDADDYFIARVDAITPATLRPLESIRSEVVAAWQADQRAQRATKKAGEVEERLKAGSTPQDIAASVPGAVAGVTPALTRAGRENGGLPPGLVQRLFEMKTAATAPTQDGQIVVRLKEIQSADPASAGAQVAQVRQGVQQAIAGDLLAQFTEALRQRYPVSIHQSTIDTMFQRN